MLDVFFEICCNKRIAELLRSETTSLKPLTPAELVLQQAQVLVGHERRMGVMEQRQDATDSKVAELEAKSVFRPDYYTIAGYANLIKEEMGYDKAKIYGQLASKIAKERNIPLDKVSDPRHGLVNYYPKSLLIEVFTRIKDNGKVPARP